MDFFKKKQKNTFYGFLQKRNERTHFRDLFKKETKETT